MSRKMKDSGIEWIGDIPDDWNITKVKYVFSDTNAGEVIDKNYWNCGEELLYTCQKTPMQSNFSNFPAWKRTGEKDLLLTRNATPYIFIPQKESIYSNVVQRIIVKEDYDLRYLSYSILLGAEALTVNGDTIPSYNMEVWKNIFIPIMDLKMQHIIADCLDDKCKEIDNIISKTQASIEEYKKLKQSIITQAVTKGVRGNREMKDSGVEWIGQIPTEWEINKVRYIGSTQNGISKGAASFGSGYPFVSYGDIYKNYELPYSVVGLIETNEDERENYSVKRGDIFFTRTSETIEEVGFSCVCKKDIENATFAGFVIRLRPHQVDDIITTDYAKYYFRGEHIRRYLVKEMNLVTRASLGQSLLKNMNVLIPPKKEQQEIAKYLDNKCFEVDKMIQNKEVAIKELELYKKSLIYEYVTGKKEVI